LFANPGGERLYVSRQARQAVSLSVRAFLFLVCLWLEPMCVSRGYRPARPAMFRGENSGLP
jgi:hypothetical protein